jgi:hypothetical protein
MAQTSSSQRMSSNHYSGYHSSGANLIPGILSSHHYQQIDPMIELEINRLDLVGIGIFNYRDFSNLHRWLAFFYAVLFLVILILIIRKIHKVLAYRLASIVLLVVYFLLLLILCLLYILNWKNPNILVPEIALFLIQGIWIVLSSVVMIVLKRRKV